jgi:hypothetical protein
MSGETGVVGTANELTHELLEQSLGQVRGVFHRFLNGENLPPQAAVAVSLML